MATYNFKLVYSIAVHMTLQYKSNGYTQFSATHNFFKACVQHCGAYDIIGLMATYSFKLVYNIAVHMTVQE